MTDLATLTKRAHDTGFERGSHVTLQTVMAWLDGCNLPHIAGALSVASQDATLERFRPDRQQAVTPAEPEPIIDPIKPTDLAPPKMTFEQAKGSGYTGNQCAICSSMRMTISGHCEKCEDCGESSGCS